MGSTYMPTREKALAGREQALRIAPTHFVTGRAVRPDGLSVGTMRSTAPELEEIHFGMGCFWGAEKMFWTIPGVFVTSVGYAGGFTPNATYEEVCSGQTGHTEVVRVVYDPTQVSLDELLRVFWEGHDPTQGMRQGGDIGTQYRSTIYFTMPGQEAPARASLEAYQQRLAAAGYGKITTEIAPAGPFYFAEDYHQQYLAKNPNGYCGHGGTGVACPIGVRA
jgi:peptide-methionine (S)-S-oxide reductase